jgi:hypothetical protein
MQKGSEDVEVRGLVSNGAGPLLLLMLSFKQQAPSPAGYTSLSTPERSRLSSRLYSSPPQARTFAPVSELDSPQLVGL